MPKEKILTDLQEAILRVLSRSPGMHFLGSALAAMCDCKPRVLRRAIRSLRNDFGYGNILSMPGDDPATCGYWLGLEPKEIEKNRKHHEHYGKDYLYRAGRMTPGKSKQIADAHGQLLMEI